MLGRIESEEGAGNDDENLKIDERATTTTGTSKGYARISALIRG